jgi:endonuclease/exonuclease/phosphatase family metal-dependent hydrolase
LLHAEVKVHGRSLHIIVVHLGLIKASRVRQIAQLQQYVQREIPPEAALVVAGDFNEWGSWLNKAMAVLEMKAATTARKPTFPSRFPLLQLDHVFARGMQPLELHVPHGRIWWRMSDHLPLIAEFDWPEIAGSSP